MHRRTAAARRIVEVVEPTESIVCGVDQSPAARTGVRFAAELADRLALRVVLVHVIQLPIPQSELGLRARTTDWDVIKELRRAGTSLLEELDQELGRGRQIQTELRFGDASNVIAGVAEHAGAALVVVGSRGMGSVGALVLGSVSLRLAASGPCPTVIVRETGGTITGSPILCAVDDSDESRAAVVVAATLAQRLDAELVLAHAEPDAARAPEGQELLARLVVECGLGTSVEKMLVRGDPAKAIVAAATARAVDMIVIGSRGRGALASAALGSVSSTVAMRASCPVTIVRAETSATV